MQIKIKTYHGKYSAGKKNRALEKLLNFFGAKKNLRFKELKKNISLNKGRKYAITLFITKITNTILNDNSIVFLNKLLLKTYKQ